MTFNTIEEALVSIDFERIAVAMRILDWKVLEQRTELGSYYPTADELRASMLELYNSITTLYPDPLDSTHLENYCQSGAFRVTKSKYTDSEMVGVYFTISANVLIAKE